MSRQSCVFLSSPLASWDVRKSKLKSREYDKVKSLLVGIPLDRERKIQGQAERSKMLVVDKTTTEENGILRRRTRFDLTEGHGS